MVARGIKFFPGPTGHKEICFAWREFVDYVRIHLTAGPPTQISNLNWGNTEEVRANCLDDFKYLNNHLNLFIYVLVLWVKNVPLRYPLNIILLNLSVMG